MHAPARIARLATVAVLATLAACDAGRAVSPDGMLAYEVSLASAGGALAIAWHGSQNGGRETIWLQPLDARARARGAPLRLTDGARDAYEPDLQLVDGDAVLAWYEKDAGGALAAWLGRFDLAGRERWRVALSPADRQGRNPVVRAGADGLHVAWLETAREPANDAPVDVRVATFDALGHARSQPVTAGAASRDTWNLNAALGPGAAFYVTYDAHAASRAKELQLLRVTADGVRATQLGDDDGFDSSYPDIAFAGDRAAITWFDLRDGNTEVYLATGSIDELTAGLAARSRRVTATPGASIGAYLAWNGPRLLVAWCDDTAGQMEVYRQEFGSGGVPAGPAVRVTDTATDSLIPAVRPAGAGFALAWTERRALPATTPAGHAPTASSQVRVERVR